MRSTGMKQWVGLGLGAALCASVFLSCRERLVPGTEVRKELRGGESDDYSLPLEPGQVLDVTVEQKGIDVSLILSAPGREEILNLDSPTGAEGLERLFAVAEAGGTYRLRIVGEGDQGSYVLRCGGSRQAGPPDRLRARAFQEYSLGEKLRQKNTVDDRRQALVHYGVAIDLLHSLGDREQQLIVLHRQFRILQDLDSPAEALKAARRALVLVRRPRDRASFLNSITALLIHLGDVQRAFERGKEALALSLRTGDPIVEAAALNNMGLIYRAWGENGKALTYFDRSLEKRKDLGLHREMALTLTNKAEAFLAIGSPEPAIKPLKDALREQEESGDQIGAARIHRTLGWAFELFGQHDFALKELEQAHKIAQETGNRWIEGLALSDLGSIRLIRGDIAQARAAFLKAERIARDDGRLDNEAYALSGLGRVLLEQGDETGALERFARSEELCKQLGDPNALSLVLYGRALAERRLGRLDDSLRSIEQALDLVETLREEVSQQRDLQASVIGARTDLYDLKVDLLLRLHERQPDRGYNADSFAASEERRARSLLEGVRRTGAAEIPPTVSRDVLRRQGALRKRLQELYLEKLKSRPENRSGVEAKLRATLNQWEDLAEEIRRESPGYAAVTAPKLVGVPEVQALLDPETALIAYTVGEERGILWWIEKDALEVHQDLPPRADLGNLASQVYEVISQRSTKQRGLAQARLARVGEILLGPVAERLPRVRRLVVVADETLQALPFAALPVPGSGEPLVASHAVVLLPSASLAAALRARQKERATPPELIAVFADPVFGLSDERFSQRRGPAGTSPRPSADLARLPESRREADDILRLVPPARSRRFVGFDANRRAALDPELARYRYIHFATHGLVDFDNPSLSGIQLSRIDLQGRPLEGEGILPFYEVYNLSLPADLVTLSACRTAVGRQVRGEGVLGMSRSFLYAGASRVMGALWDVDDADAADLMVLFYQGLLHDRLSPAVALQRAQNALRTRARRDTPYNWAGFVLQGDWR